MADPTFTFTEENKSPPTKDEKTLDPDSGNTGEVGKEADELGRHQNFDPYKMGRQFLEGKNPLESLEEDDESDAQQEGKEPDPSKEEGQDGSETTEKTDKKSEEKDGKEDEEGEEGEPEGLSKLDVKSLLDHPVLGPKLRSWSDSNASKQNKSMLSKARRDWDDEAKVAAFEHRIDAMDARELGEALQEPEFSKAYAQIIERRRKAEDEQENEDIARTGSQYGLIQQIKVNQALISESGLNEEVKKSLNPDNFAELGEPGIAQWTLAIHKALLDQEVSKRVQSELETKWEAYREEQLGGDSSIRKPDISNGRVRTPISAEDLKNMTPDQINALPEEQVHQALREQAALSKRK